MKKKEVARKMLKGEKEAIRDYGHAIKHSKGKEKKTYKHILPDEKEHAKELKEL